MIDLGLRDEPFLYVSLKQQHIELRESEKVIKQYIVSTAKNGPGELFGSECTPRGWHRIRAKIGEGLPVYSILVGRRPSGEIYSPQIAVSHSDRDWILTRILWLSGLEPNYNRFGDVDTARRYIYIHGSPDHEVTQKPSSHGCIRMKNADVIELFNRVDCKTRVLISD